MIRILNPVQPFRKRLSQGTQEQHRKALAELFLPTPFCCHAVCLNHDFQDLGDCHDGIEPIDASEIMIITTIMPNHGSDKAQATPGMQ